MCSAEPQRHCGQLLMVDKVDRTAGQGTIEGSSGGVEDCFASDIDALNCFPLGSGRNLPLDSERWPCKSASSGSTRLLGVMFIRRQTASHSAKAIAKWGKVPLVEALFKLHVVSAYRPIFRL
jgi:hypothetical protein